MLSLSRYAGTVDRTYYVMFEAASAMLASLGFEFDSHYGLKIKFGELLVKTRRVDRRFAHYLSRAFDLRDDACTRSTAEPKYHAKLQNRSSVGQRNS